MKSGQFFTLLAASLFLFVPSLPVQSASPPEKHSAIKDLLEYVNFWHELQYRHQMTDSFNATLKLYWDQFDQDASIKIQPNGFAGSYPYGMI